MKPLHVLCLLLLCLLVGACAAERASACGRCGLFGRHCRFTQQSHYVPQVQYVYPPASTVVINQVYPAPVQGATVYGYSAEPAQLQAVDPNEALRQLGRLAEKGIDGYAELALTTTSAQSAVEALRASAALVETRRLEVRQGQAVAAEGEAAVTAPLILAKCAKCHSGGTDAPGPTLTATSRLSGAILAQVVAEIDSGRMPKQGGPLTPLERATVIADAARLLEE